MAAMPSAFMRLCRRSFANSMASTSMVGRGLGKPLPLPLRPATPRTPLPPSCPPAAPRTPLPPSCPPAAPRTPLPPSCPPAAPRTPTRPPHAAAAVGNLELESWRRFSTEGMKWADQKNPLSRTHQAESAPYMWLRRSSDRVKYFIKEEPITVCVVFGWMASMCYIAWMSRAIHRNSLDSSARAGKYREFSAVNFPYFVLPAFRTMHVNAIGSGDRKRKAKADDE